MSHKVAREIARNIIKEAKQDLERGIISKEEYEWLVRGAKALLSGSPPEVK